FGLQVANIVRDGLQRMYGGTEQHPEGENVFYYLTVYNDPYPQPPEPQVDDPAQLRQEILAGLYRYQVAPAIDDASTHDDEARPGAHNLASGVRSEEHTSELQSRFALVCRLLLEQT